MKKHAQAYAETFTPGWLGNYFVKLMQPQQDGTAKKKMKAPANARPVPALDPKAVLNEYMAGQRRLCDLLTEAKQADIGGIRVPTSLSSLIRLKMGDTFRFLIAHQHRHTNQMKRTLAAVQRQKAG